MFAVWCTESRISIADCCWFSAAATVHACQGQVETASCMATDYPHLNHSSESYPTLIAQHCTLQIKYQYHWHLRLNLAPVYCSSVRTVHVYTPTPQVAPSVTSVTSLWPQEAASATATVTASHQVRLVLAACISIVGGSCVHKAMHYATTCMPSGTFILLPSVWSASTAGTAWIL
jgi:hypothetical protein